MWDGVLYRVSSLLFVGQCPTTLSADWSEVKDPANSSTITGYDRITMEDDDGLSALPDSTVESKRQMEKSKIQMIKCKIFTRVILVHKSCYIVTLIPKLDW